MEESDTNTQRAPTVVYHDEPEYIFHDDSKVPSPKGFGNTGAICWWNSLLQFMLTLSSINQAVVRARDNLRGNPFATAYVDLVERSIAGMVTTMESAHLFELFKCRLVAMKSTANMNGQSCADEGYVLFIDALDCPEVRNLTRNVYENTVMCTHCNKVTSSTRDDANQICLFDLDNVHDQVAFCRRVHVSNSNVDVFTCAACNQKSYNCTRYYIAKVLREVIVIVLNKFESKSVVYYPDELVFPSNEYALVYKLKAVVCHSGTRYGGHYWANVNRGGNIYNVNDFQVSTGSMQYSTESFLLAYVLVDKRLR